MATAAGLASTAAGLGIAGRWGGLFLAVAVLAGVVFIILAVLRREELIIWIFHERDEGRLMLVVGAVVSAFLFILFATAWGKSYYESYHNKLNVSAILLTQAYTPGLRVGGILWEDRFSRIRVELTNDGTSEVSDIDLRFTPDKFIWAAAVSNGPSDCKLTNAAAFKLRPEISMSGVDSDGKNLTIVPDLLDIQAPEATYRMTCSRMAANTGFSVNIATAKIGQIGAGPIDPPGRDDPTMIMVVGSYTYENERVQVRQRFQLTEKAGE